MSTLRTRKITPIDGETNLQLGESGQTITLATGAIAVGFAGNSESELLALKTDIALNFFLDAVNHARGVQNLSDGFVDQFEDQLGVDDPNSTNETYDVSGDFYNPSILNSIQSPDMTGLTSPSGTVSSTDEAPFPSWYAFDRSTGQWRGELGDYIQYQYNNGLSAITPTRLVMQCTGTIARTPIAFTLKASNTGSFSGEETTLVNATGLTWTASERKTWDFVNTTAYEYYRWVTTSITQYTVYDYAELELYEDVSTSNMTLVSEPSTALSAPDTAQVTIFKEDVDAVTLNTDLIAWASRSKQTITATNATNVLNATTHGLSDNDRVMVTSSGQDLPLGLDSETVYYVVTATTSTFQVALTSGGSAVALTDDGTGTHSVLAVTAATLVNQSTISPYNTVNASVDISGQPSDTNMTLIVQTKNTKNVKIHGQSLQWS